MTSRDDLAQALQPLLARIGAQLVTDGDERDGDIAVAWTGGPSVRVRLAAAMASDEPGGTTADLSDGLARLIGEVERELGSPLAALARPGKQRAVRLLEERGAFEMRRSAETVAEALGVTRFTVYNYLNRSSPPKVSTDR
jgi:hypothetical protein